VWVSWCAHTHTLNDDGRRTKENKHMTLADELSPRASVFGSEESQSAILDLNPKDFFAFRFERPLVEFSRPEYEVIDPVPVIPIEVTRDTFCPRSTNVVLVRPWNGSFHSSSLVNDSHLPSTKQVPSPLLILRRVATGLSVGNRHWCACAGADLTIGFPVNV